MRVNQKILLLVWMAFLNAGEAIEVDVRPDCHTFCPISAELGVYQVTQCVLAKNPTIHIHIPYPLFDAKFPDNNMWDPERMKRLNIQKEDLVGMRALLIFDDTIYLPLASASDAEWDALQKLPASRNILTYDELKPTFPSLIKLKD
jgi:hypothetical protein